MSWTVAANGTQASSANGVEYTLASPTTAGTYVYSVSLVNMALGDTTVLRAYKLIDGSSYAVLFEFGFNNPQATGCIFPAISLSSGFGLKFTLNQTAGTGESYPWLVEVI